MMNQTIFVIGGDRGLGFALSAGLRERGGQRMSALQKPGF